MHDSLFSIDIIATLKIFEAVHNMFLLIVKLAKKK